MSDNVLPNELYYLADGFSPRSLRRYQLKSILKSYNINVPPSFKKADMVKLFQKHIESRREAILTEYKKEQEAIDTSNRLGRGHRKMTPVRRYLSGEVEEKPLSNSASDKKLLPNVQDGDNSGNNQQGQERVNDEAGFAIPHVPESWHRRHKISKKSPTPEQEPPSLQQQRQQQVASESKEHPLQAPKRRGKQSHTTPSFTAQDSFASSDDDVFLSQKVEEMRDRRAIKSKRHPINPPRLPEASLAIGSDSSSMDVESRAIKSRPAKKREERDVIKGDDDSASDESYATNSSDDEASDEEEELDEELAPSNITGDEVKWLVEDIAKRGSTWETTFRAVGIIYKVLLVLTIATTALILGSRHRNGYCNSESVQPDKDYYDRGLSYHMVLPELCIPCPDHGTCVDGKLHCPAFFTQRHHWYNINGVLPFADECVRDSATGRAIARVEKKIKRELARQQGNVVCKHLVETGSTKNSPLAKTSGAALFTRLLTKDYAHMEDTGKLEIIISEALKSILDDTKVHYWDLEGIPYYGTDDVKLPLWCSLYGVYTTVPVRIRWTIVAVLISGFATAYGRYTYTHRKSVQSKTHQQVIKILSELQEQLNRYMEDPDNQDRGYAVSQLRAKLTDANSPDSLADWMRVVKEIKREPQIRRGYREIGGEICEYWELAA